MAKMKFRKRWHHMFMKAILKKRLKNQIENFAKNLGFDLVGFTLPKIPNKNVKALKNWLKCGFEGDMDYMSEAKRARKRLNPSKILNGAKTVIVLGMNYYKVQSPLRKGCGRIARYAYGRDYHKIIGKKLRALEKFIAEIAAKNLPSKKVFTKSYADTGPILERALAESAGLGVVGKNCCLITKDFGSWIFLAEIFTNLDLANRPSASAKTPFKQKGDFPSCGQCQRCKNACPTGAIIAPGIINARKCISYLTIETKRAIPEKLAKIISKSGRLFGCDICQEVCPHNISRQKPAAHAELMSPKIAGDQLNLKKLRAIKTDAEFLKLFAGSPLMRAKRRNLMV